MLFLSHQASHIWGYSQLPTAKPPFLSTYPLIRGADAETANRQRPPIPNGWKRHFLLGKTEATDELVVTISNVGTLGYLLEILCADLLR